MAMNLSKYRIKSMNGQWHVVEGYIEYGNFMTEDYLFKGSVADCYAWIKAKEEGLILNP